MTKLFISIVFAINALAAPDYSRAQSIEDAVGRCISSANSWADPQRPSDVVGLSLNQIKPQIAIPACQAALQIYPNDGRLLTYYGRALQAAGRDSEAERFYQKSTKYPFGLYSLATIMERVAPQNAINVYTKAYNLGVTHSADQISYLYVYDMRLVDYGDKWNEAEKWTKLSNGMGDNVGGEYSFRLGRIYHWILNQRASRKQSVKSDITPQMAIDLLNSAAKNGRRDAATIELARIYYEGKFVPANVNLAVSMIQKEVDNKNPNAVLEFGYMYYNGTGVAENKKLGLVYFQKAAAMGSDLAKAALESIAQAAVSNTDSISGSNDSWVRYQQRMNREQYDLMQHPPGSP